ncbi:F-box/kelch-repeat protein At3g23880-like [Bidens hawaiensis]|uniref:F-box/kelch-repeat protein At3g23880-like n=1 Tax=Bidens hawaiensis TaxID=980011 RepID=UPI00404A3FC6
MSDEIQMEVMKLLPIKSLIQFRCVSKPWKSVIESSDFIADYTVSSRDQPHHLLISYQNNENDVYVSIADNDSFPLNMGSPALPHPINYLLWDSRVVGTSRGVICLLGYHRNLYGSHEAVFWNPSIRKSVAIAVPDDVTCSCATGFGVCPATTEPKLVKINKRVGVTWQVEVFSLTWHVWRISPSNPPDKLLEFKPSSQSVVDRFIYWLGVTSGGDTGIMIISFDLLSEEFGEIHLPEGV